MDHLLTIMGSLLIYDIQKESLERMRNRDSNIKIGLGRFLLRNTPKVKSLTRGERSGTAKEVEVTSVSIHVVWDDDAPGDKLKDIRPEVPLSDNDNAMYKKYGKTISEGILNPTIRVEGSESPRKRK